MGISDDKQALESVRDSAKIVLAKYFGGEKPAVFTSENAATFFGGLGEASRLMVAEPEILFFAVLQWVVIGLAYLCWTRMLSWIPDAVWQTVAQESRDNQKGIFDLINIALLVWSFVVVVTASYPIAICSAAIVAARNLRTLGESANVFRCLWIAERHVGRLWIYTSIDAWITVEEILARLPKKHYNHTALDEFLYYAWKVGTMGLLPALVAGKGFIDAGKDSLTLLGQATKRAIQLRLGYSMVCWVVGVLAYVGGIVYLKAVGPVEQTHEIYNIYFVLFVPILIAVGIVVVLVRPFYIIMLAKLYTDVLTDKVIADEAGTRHTRPGAVGYVLRVVFVLLALGLLAAYFFGDSLGINQFISDLAAKDFSAVGR